MLLGCHELECGRDFSPISSLLVFFGPLFSCPICGIRGVLRGRNLHIGGTLTLALTNFLDHILSTTPNTNFHLLGSLQPLPTSHFLTLSIHIAHCALRFGLIFPFTLSLFQLLLLRSKHGSSERSFVGSNARQTNALALIAFPRIRVQDCLSGERACHA